MLILSLESSAKPASVALCSDGKLLGQYFQNSGLTHSRTLLVMAESLLRNLDISTTDIDFVAVSRGPGSFTGVRIGVSAAKGLAWGLDKPVCSVSTLEALAYQTPESGVLICPVMDARRGQVYNALFEWRDAMLVRLCDDRAVSLEDLSAELHGTMRASSPITSHSPLPDAMPPRFQNPNSELRVPSSPLLLVGDGAQLSYDYLSAAGIPCRIAPDLMRWQTAYGVALAAMSAERIPATELEPSYLRPSQAERERQGQMLNA